MDKEKLETELDQSIKAAHVGILENIEKYYACRDFRFHESKIIEGKLQSLSKPHT